jgi:uncharacterized membrane protein YkvA (DUF1232 family)
MTEKKPGDLMVTPSGGFLHEFAIRLKLIGRLMGDSRVNFLLKALPIASIIYLISPVDLSFLVAYIPGITALDDIAIISLANYLFVELCPPYVVQEHMKSLTSNMDSAPASEEIVDAESTDLPDEKK